MILNAAQFGPMEVCPFVQGRCIGDRCRMWMVLTATDEVAQTKTETGGCGIGFQTHALIDVVNLLKKQVAYMQQSADADKQRADYAGLLTGEALKRIRQQ